MCTSERADAFRTVTSSLLRRKSNKIVIENRSKNTNTGVRSSAVKNTRTRS
jgi:hypothetical protein